MGLFLGSCGSGDTTFELEVTVPEYYEGSEPGADVQHYSDLIYVRPGIWSVSYARTSIDWSGAPHTFDIYYVEAGMQIMDGATLQPPWIIYFTSLAFWPCDSGSNSFFVAPDNASGMFAGKPISYHLDLEDVSGNGAPCTNGFMIDLGCPNCNNTRPVMLNVSAGLTADFPPKNSRSFKITATGTWIG